MNEPSHRVKTHRFELQVADQQQAKEMQEWMTHWNVSRLGPVLDEVCSRLSMGKVTKSIEQLDINLGVVSLEVFEQRFAQALEQELSNHFSIEQNGIRQDPEAEALALLQYFLLTGTLSWRSQIEHREDLRRLLDKLHRNPSQAFTEFIKNVSQDTVKLHRMVAAFSDKQLFQTLGLLASFPLQPIEQVLSELQKLANDFKIQSPVWRHVFWESFGTRVQESSDAQSLTGQLLIAIDRCFVDQAHQVSSVIQRNKDLYPTLSSWQKGLEAAQEIAPWELPRLIQSLQQLSLKYPQLSSLISELRDSLTTTTFMRFAMELRVELMKDLKALVQLFPGGYAAEAGSALDEKSTARKEAITDGSTGQARYNELDMLIHFLEKGTLPQGVLLTEQALPELFNQLNRRPTPAFKQQMGAISQKATPMRRMVDVFSDTQLIRFFTHLSGLRRPHLSKLMNEFEALGQALSWNQQELRFVFWLSTGHFVHDSSHAPQLAREVMQRAIWRFGNKEEQVMHAIWRDPDRYPLLRAWHKELSGEEVTILWKLPRLLDSLQSQDTKNSVLAELATELASLLSTPSFLATIWKKQEQLIAGLKKILELFTPSVSASEQRVRVKKAEEQLRSMLKEIHAETDYPAQTNDLEKLSYYLRNGLFPLGTHQTRLTASTLFTQLNCRPSPAFRQLLGDITKEKLSLQRMVNAFSDTLLIKTFAPLLKVSRYQITKPLAEFKALGQALKWDEQMLRMILWQSIGEQVYETFDRTTFIWRVMQMISWSFTEDQQTILRTLENHEGHYPILHAWQSDLQQSEIASISEPSKSLRRLQSLAKDHAELSARINELRDIQRTISFLPKSDEFYSSFTAMLKELLVIYAVDSSNEDKHIRVQEVQGQLRLLIKSISDESFRPIEKTDLELFRFFLQHGVLPTDVPPARANLTKILTRLSDQPSGEFEQLIGGEILTKKLPLQRMVIAFSDTQLLKTFRSLLTINKSQLSKPLAEFKALGQALDWDKQAIRIVFWKSIQGQMGRRFHLKTWLKDVMHDVIWSFGLHEQQFVQALQRDADKFSGLRNWYGALQTEEIKSLWELPRLLETMKKLSSEHAVLSEISEKLAGWQRIPTIMFVSKDPRSDLTERLKEGVEAFTAHTLDKEGQDTTLEAEDELLPSEASITREPINPAHPKALQLLSFYLTNDVLPEDKPLTRRTLTQLLINLNDDPTQAFKQLMSKVIKQRSSLSRMVHTFSDTQLIKTFTPLLTLGRPQCSKLLAEFTQLGQALTWDKQSLRIVFWQSIGYHAFGSVTGESLLKQVSEEVLWAFGSDQKQLWSELLENKGHYPMLRTWYENRQEDSVETPSWLYEILKEKEVSLERSLANSKLLKALKDLFDSQQLHLVVPQKRLNCLHGAHQIVDVLSLLETDVGVPLDRLSSHQSEAHHPEYSAQQHPIGMPSHEDHIADDSLPETINAEEVARQIQKVHSLLHQLKQVQPTTRSKLDLNAFDQADFVGVFNAGLVIFWPFMERLFENLELMSDKSFLDQQSEHKAVQVLNTLETGEPESGFEPMMVLSKVLCGVEISEPLIPFWLEEEEQEIVDGMLEVVIEKGPLWKNLSLDNMRTAYIQREGLLKSREGYWLLQVKRETHDITLERLSWSFQVIKLPWMAAPLQVEWI